MASEQHGVRYGRHWLDVLRYADLDENMPAAPGIHLWRDWVISALNRDLPYDEFVRAQICGNRAAQRRIISAAGHCTRIEPRPEDLFALGFLARGATSRTELGSATGHFRGRNDLERIPRHDGRLREVPRPLLRSDQANRLLLDESAV